LPFEALQAGVTTLVAALGTDSLTRTPAQVLGKVREFRAAGVSAFMYTGSYHLPVKTLTGSVESDIMLIPEVLGVGEVAISDHRSSAPTHDELARLASEARVAGLLAGKSGVSFFHLGDGRGALAPLRALRDGTDIPLRQLYPTHCNRNPWLFAEAIDWGAGRRGTRRAHQLQLGRQCQPAALRRRGAPHRAALRPDREPVAAIQPGLCPRRAPCQRAGGGHGQPGQGAGADRQGDPGSGAGCGSAAHRPRDARHRAGDERRPVASLSGRTNRVSPFPLTWMPPDFWITGRVKSSAVAPP